MTKSFWVCALVLPLFLWFSFFFVLQENYRIRQLFLENTVSEYTKLVAKKGSFQKSAFDELYDKLKKSGDMDLSLTAFRWDGDKQVEEHGYKLVNRDLRLEGFDGIEITVQYKKNHPLSALLSYDFFFGNLGKRTEIPLCASSSCLIQ